VNGAEFVAKYFPEAKKSGNGWMARCPAHQDKTPSLSISEGREGILMNCLAGCAFESVTAARGIEASELFFKPNAGRWWWTKSTTPENRGQFLLNWIFCSDNPVVVPSKAELRQRIDRWMDDAVKEAKTL
jgi:hypothetical protein